MRKILGEIKNGKFDGGQNHTLTGSSIPLHLLPENPSGYYWFEVDEDEGFLKIEKADFDNPLEGLLKLCADNKIPVKRF